jgi:succinate dehydrogenase/fumarate reductase cytochrome b subunit
MILNILQNIIGLVITLFILVLFFYAIAGIPLLMSAGGPNFNWKTAHPVYHGPFALTKWIILYPFIDTAPKSSV